MKLKQLRPKTLKKFVGKKHIKENLKIFIDAAKIKKTSLEHCLFYGLPGTGKTSLAYIIANELKTKIKTINGCNIQKPIDVYNLILTLKENEIIFIDEIHAINPSCFEIFYLLLEDYCLDISIGKDFNSKITRISIPNFTLVGATTSLGKLPKAFEERFGIMFSFEDYEISEIKEILVNGIKYMNLSLSDKDIDTIASNCKGIPRIAIMLLSRISDFIATNQKLSISQILKKLNIYKDGLNYDDINYLKKLYDVNIPIGIKTLCQMTGFEQNFIENKIEPYLIKNNYIVKTIGGRKLTNKSKELIEKFNS